MNSRMSVIFLCIVLVMAIIFGGVMISSVSNEINMFKKQIDNTSACLPHQSPGIEPIPLNAEPDN